MEFFDEFKIIGGIIPNLIGLAVFCGVIIYFDQTRKAKVRRGEKVPPSSIKMILFAKSEIIGGIVPNLIAFSLFLGAIGYFTLTEKMAEIFGIRKRPKSD